MTGKDEHGGFWFARVNGSRNRPVRWQGWLAMGLYIVALGGTPFLFAFGDLAVVGGFAVVTALFAFVVLRKSAPGRYNHLVVRD